MSDNFEPVITKEYKKCAPSKKFSDGSCFTINALTKMANAYNKHVGFDAIKMTDSKKDLVKELTEKIKECKDQLCWLTKDYVKNINDHDIHNNTFRPVGPQARFKWLSTTNINEIVSQYEDKYKDFKFYGAVPIDFEDISQLEICNLNLDQITNKGITKIGTVINLDEHYKSGSHWVSLYADLADYKIYYFDSYGTKPRKRITNFVKKLAIWCHNKSNPEDNIDDTETKFMSGGKLPEKYKNIDIYYNKVRHQFGNSECGVYSVNFILRLLKGETFDYICNNITLDDKVNECRETYFRFK
jgi:hypothetical protein